MIISELARPVADELWQEESADVLHIIVSFLLWDGRQMENTFILMSDLGVFSRLLELIEMGKEDESGLHMLMLKLVYEMSRIQRLRLEELGKCCGQSGMTRRI